jgi:hypothetical protein
MSQQLLACHAHFHTLATLHALHHNVDSSTRKSLNLTTAPALNAKAPGPSPLYGTRYNDA